MTTEAGIEAAGTFKIGGDMLVHRFGYGAMRITGPGMATLDRLPKTT